jgi:hypothetical protein
MKHKTGEMPLQKPESEQVEWLTLVTTIGDRE